MGVIAISGCGLDVCKRERVWFRRGSRGGGEGGGRVGGLATN